MENILMDSKLWLNRDLKFSCPLHLLFLLSVASRYVFPKIGASPNGICNFQKAGSLVLKDVTGRYAQRDSMYFKQVLIGMIFCVVALHATAQTSFTRIYSSVERTWGSDVVKTKDGGYLIAGDSIRYTSESDIYLVKTDSLGEQEWTNTFGITDKQEKTAGVINTSDNGFLVTGMVRFSEFAYYPFAYKTDSAGNVVWARDTIAGFGTSTYEAIETPDKGFLLTGGCGSYGVGLLKLDSVGNTEWDLSFGGGFGNGSSKIVELLDSGFLVLASNYPYARILRLDDFYSPVWDKTFTASEMIGFSDVYLLKDSSFIITGYKYEGEDLSNILVMKINRLGDSLWSKSFSGGSSPTGSVHQDYGVSIVENSDSTLSVYCQLQGLPSILYLTSDGDSISTKAICGGNPGSMIKDGNSLVITGEYFDPFNVNQIYAFLVKTDSLGNFEDLINGIGYDVFGSSDEKWMIYPNPAREEFFVRTTFSEPSILKAYDLMGRVVYSSQIISVNEPYTMVDVRDWNNGLYMVELGERRVKIVVNH